MSKMKLTLNNYEGESFHDKFYLLDSGNMYCIYLKDSHAVVISQPDFQKALKCFNDLLHKYGTFTKFTEELRNCEYPVTKVAPAVLKLRQEDYKKRGEQYIDDVEHVINMFDDYTKGVLKEKTKVKPLVIKKKIIKKRA